MTCLRAGQRRFGVGRRLRGSETRGPTYAEAITSIIATMDWSAIQDELDKLESFKANLPARKRFLPESYVQDFHKILDRLAVQGMSFDDDCRIGGHLLEKRFIGRSAGITSYSKGREVERDQLSRRLDMVIRILTRKIKINRETVSNVIASNMNSTNLSKKQLELLKDLVETGCGGDGGNTEFYISEALARAPEVAFLDGKEVSPVSQADLAELLDAGYVRLTRYNSQGNPLHTVTNKGIKFVESGFKEQAQPISAGGSVINVTNIHGPVTGSNIGSPGATVNWNTLLPEVRELVQELRLAYEKEPPPKDADVALTDIETLEVQLRSDKPRAGIVRECLASLRTITESVAGSAAWAGLQVKIVELLPKLQALIPGAS